MSTVRAPTSDAATPIEGRIQSLRQHISRLASERDGSEHEYADVKHEYDKLSARLGVLRESLMRTSQERAKLIKELDGLLQEKVRQDNGRLQQLHANPVAATADDKTQQMHLPQPTTATVEDKTQQMQRPQPAASEPEPEPEIEGVALDSPADPGISAQSATTAAAEERAAQAAAAAALHAEHVAQTSQQVVQAHAAMSAEPAPQGRDSAPPPVQQEPPQQVIHTTPPPRTTPVVHQPPRPASAAPPPARSAQPAAAAVGGQRQPPAGLQTPPRAPPGAAAQAQTAAASRTPPQVPSGSAPPPRPAAVAPAPAIAAAGAPAGSIQDRKKARVPLAVEVDFSSENNLFVGFSEDISEGGLFVATFSPRPVGDHLSVQFRLPGQGRVMTVDTVVAWSVPQREDHDGSVGMGLRFVNLTDDDRRALTQFIEQREPLFFPGVS